MPKLARLRPAYCPSGRSSSGCVSASRSCKVMQIQRITFQVDRTWYTCNVLCLRTGTMRSRGGCLGSSPTGGGVSLSYPLPLPPGPPPNSRHKSTLVWYRWRCHGGTSRCQGVATSCRFLVYGSFRCLVFSSFNFIHVFTQSVFED